MGTEQLSGRFRFVFFFGGGRSWRSRCLAAHMSKAVNCVWFLKDCDQWTTRLVLAQLSQRSNAVTANAFSKSLLSKWLCASGTENSSSARWIVSNHETGRSVEPHQRISGTLWSDSSVWLPVATTFSYLTIVWTLEAAVTLYFVCVFGCYHICAGANGCGGTIREPPSCPRISKNTVFKKFIKIYRRYGIMYTELPIPSIHLPLCICITCVIT